MAIALMTAVWGLNIPLGPKMVALALADSANAESGVTWIPIERRDRSNGKVDLLRKTSMSKRAIQNGLRWLESNQVLSRSERPGKGVIYVIHPSQAVHLMHPALDAPVHETTPRGAPGAPKPKETVMLEGVAPAAIADLGVSDEQWAGFVAMRKKNRNPLTDHAVKLAATELAKLKEQGHEPGAVVDQSTLRGWAGFFPLKGHGHERTGDATASAANNPMVTAALEFERAPRNRNA